MAPRCLAHARCVPSACQAHAWWLRLRTRRARARHAARMREAHAWQRAVTTMARNTIVREYISCMCNFLSADKAKWAESTFIRRNKVAHTKVWRIREYRYPKSHIGGNCGERFKYFRITFSREFFRATWMTNFLCRNSIGSMYYIWCTRVSLVK